MTTYDNYCYSWNDRAYPYFYPADDELRGEGYYIVEFQLTCYPYARGSQFNAGAFPPSLKHFGENGNTNFYFVAHDEEGNELVGLDWDEAVQNADALNAAYEEVLDEAQESWDWESVEYAIETSNLVYNK